MDTLTHKLFNARLLAPIGLVCLLSACGGGGGGSSTPSTGGAAANVSAEAAESTSANAAVIPDGAALASATTLTTTQAVVAAGQASATINCTGGGTAVYQVTGPNAALLDNGKLDAGENYTLTFNGCRGALGAAALTGEMTLDVTAATAASVTVNTTTNNLVASLPQGTVTLNGSSTLSQSVATSGSEVTTTTGWISSGITVTTEFNGRGGSFTLSQVNVTQSVNESGGVLEGSTFDGTVTFTASGALGALSFTLSTDGAASYNANGEPVQGTWNLILPNNSISLTIAGNVATVNVDYGNNGTIDATYTFTIAALVADSD
jgi:hypothetical protein